MLITIIQIIIEIIKRRKEEINILILTGAEIERIDLSPLEEYKDEAKKKNEFDIYMGNEKIN